MDFEPSEFQVELATAVRQFCVGRFPMEYVRTLTDRTQVGGAAVDRERWRELADLGLFSIRLPEQQGGLGLGLGDAVLAFEELGRSAVPGPLVATHLASDFFPEAASGELVFGLVEDDGGPCFVEHLASLDVLLALRSDGVYRIDPASVVGTLAARPTDAWTPVTEVSVLPVGERVPGTDAEVTARLRSDGAILTAAMLVGLATSAVELANAYAKQREQFGKPIGMFQAVKHLLADSFARAEVARAAVHSAAVLRDQPEVADPTRAMHGAKILAGEAAVLNGKSGIQVHGGMGFTWEVDAHIYLKRAWVLDTHFGSVDEHCAALAELV